MSYMFTSILKESALDWFLNSLSTEIAYSETEDTMIEQYNLPHRKAAQLSAVDSIKFSTSKKIYGIGNERTTVNRMIKYLDQLIPQLAADFQTGAQKMRLINNAVFGLE